MMLRDSKKFKEWNELSKLRIKYNIVYQQICKKVS